MFDIELHYQRAQELRADARMAAATSPSRRARQWERISRVLSAGAAWTKRRSLRVDRQVTPLTIR